MFGDRHQHEAGKSIIGFKCGRFLKTDSQLQLLIMKLEGRPDHTLQSMPNHAC